jgi:phosphotransferase system IIB component
VGASADRALPALLAALGGAANLRAVESHGTRVLVQVAAVGSVDLAALRAAGARAAAFSEAGTLHLVVGPEAAALAKALGGARTG